MVLLLVFMQLTRDLFAIAKFLLSYVADRQTDGLENPTHTDRHSQWPVWRSSCSHPTKCDWHALQTMCLAHGYMSQSFFVQV